MSVLSRHLWRWIVLLTWLSGCGAPPPLPPQTQAGSPAPAASPTDVVERSMTPAPSATRPFSTRPTSTGAAQQQTGGAAQAVVSPTLIPTLNAWRLCLPATPAEVGEVAWVINGQVIVVRINERFRSVRLLGIQAPAYQPNIAFMGPPAFRQVRAWLEHRLVNLYRAGADADELGQLLRYVTTNDTLFVNYELLRLGLAQVAPEQGAAQTGTPTISAAAEPTCRAAFLEAQRRAQGQQIGLWGEAVIGAASSPTETLMGGAAALAAPTASLEASPIFTLTPGASSTPTLSNGAPGSTATLTPTFANGSATAGAPTTSAPTTRAPTVTRATGTSTAAPTLTASVIATFAGVFDIYINDLIAIGTLPNQADEYVKITNDGKDAVQMQGWRLHTDSSNKDFIFPSYMLAAGGICRVYANIIRADSCANESFHSPTQLWLDDEFDCVTLYRPNGLEEDSYCNQ